jgi:riboflavin biosynthesis pyrimidine reductase
VIEADDRRRDGKRLQGDGTMTLPTTLTLAYHERDPLPREVPLDQVYRDLDLSPVGGEPVVIVNMVQTLDGAVAVDGKAWALGSEVDHYLFRTLRGWADAVLSGAGTLRQNDIVAVTHPHLQAARVAAGRPPHPTAVVVSRQAEFSDDVLRKRFFTRRDFASLVIATELTRPEARRRVEEAGAELLIVPTGPDGEVDLAAALALLATRGLQRVLAEGGPQTNRRLFAARLVEQLFLTVTPRIVGAPLGHEILAGALGGIAADLRLISEYQYRDPSLREWYFRFRVLRAGLSSTG